MNPKNVDVLCETLIGSRAWLIAKELQYGGRHTNVERRRVSPYDPRTKTQIKSGGMTGGDRMLYHAYAEHYHNYLSPFLNREVILVEIGILRGTGLAIWCDLFEKGRICGLDIDLSHAKDNLKHLKRLGAFSKNSPELYEFDQFLDNREYLLGLLGNDRVDICIDDGFHSNESIAITFRSVLPCLSDNFVYFIEDNSTVSSSLARAYTYLSVKSYGMLTVITPK